MEDSEKVYKFCVEMRRKISVVKKFTFTQTSTPPERIISVPYGKLGPYKLKLTACPFGSVFSTCTFSKYNFL